MRLGRLECKVERFEQWTVVGVRDLTDEPHWIRYVSRRGRISPSVVVVCKEDVALEGPEGVLKTHKRGLPVVEHLKVRDNLEEVFVPPAFVVLPQGSRGIVCLRFVVENARYENDGDDVASIRLFPPVEERRKEGVYDLLVVPLSVTSELPKLATDLNEDSDLGGEGTIDNLRRWRDVGSGNLYTISTRIMGTLANYLLPVDIERLHLRLNHSNERHLFLDVQTAPDQCTTQPPHVVPPEVLILKYELDAMSTESFPVYLVDVSTTTSRQHRAS